ncbi:hypothetical protein [Bacillus nitratireducens]|uniref:hypothetical protein n=1 Tax=Bacillus nitratireducens TaxID=2026193 RepID=UPI002E24201C|nr:hypothetical protein [Bacillus nitratireducens]
MPPKKHSKKMEKCYKLENKNINSSPDSNDDQPSTTDPSLDYWNNPNLMPIVEKKCEK